MTDTNDSLEFIRKNIPAKYNELNRFFRGMLTMDDISRFCDKDITYDSFDPNFAGPNDYLAVPSHCDVVVLWQWSGAQSVSALFIPKPFARIQISNLIPRSYVARRVAVMAMTDVHVSVNLIYVLNGIVSSTDPIHEEIRNGR